MCTRGRNLNVVSQPSKSWLVDVFVKTSHNSLVPPFSVLCCHSGKKHIWGYCRWHDGTRCRLHVWFHKLTVGKEDQCNAYGFDALEQEVALCTGVCNVLAFTWDSVTALRFSFRFWWTMDLWNHNRTCPTEFNQWLRSNQRQNKKRCAFFFLPEFYFNIVSGKISLKTSFWASRKS